MNSEFFAEAREELLEAALYYDAKETGLGTRFRNEVAHVLERIEADPFLWRERRGGWRKVNCPVFPYYVPYIVRKDLILIAAVAHGSRRPGYWLERLRQR